MLLYINGMLPIVLIPGFSGSILTRKSQPTKRVLHKDVIDNVWLNVQPFSTARMRRWKKDMYYTIRRDEYGVIQGFKDYDSDIQPYEIGGTRGVRNLVPEFELLHSGYQQNLDSLFHYKYFNALCEHLEGYGWRENYNLYGFPYDFRLILDPKVRLSTYNHLTTILKKAKMRTGKKSVVVAHSLGGLLMLWYLVEHCRSDWVKEHIHSIISVNVPYGGSPFTLKVCTSGSYFIPMYQDTFKEELMRNSGIIMCFPNHYGFGIKDPLYEVDNGLAITMEEYRRVSLLPFELWTRYIPDMLNLIHLRSKEFQIPVYGFIGKNKETDGRYKSKGLEQTPYETINVLGDGVVPSSSLESIIDIYSKVEISSEPFMLHADILKEPWFHNAVHMLAIDTKI